MMNRLISTRFDKSLHKFLHPSSSICLHLPVNRNGSKYRVVNSAQPPSITIFVLINSDKHYTWSASLDPKSLYERKYYLQRRHCDKSAHIVCVC